MRSTPSRSVNGPFGPIFRFDQNSSNSCINLTKSATFSGQYDTYDNRPERSSYNSVHTIQYPLRAQVAREDTYYPPIFSSIPTNNCAPSRDLEIFPTDYSPLQHCLNFFLDLNAVQNTYSLVHRDLETDVPLAIPVPLVLQTLKQAFKSQYKDLKRMLLNDTNFVNNDTTKVTNSDNKLIKKRVLPDNTNFVTTRQYKLCY